jgi:4-amino-4-deoxy-L-arabinose transferase-like glycosyltransferase
MTLCFFSIGALYFYFAFLKEENLKRKCVWSVFIFLLLGLSILVKGPVGLIYFGIPVFTWTLLGQHWKTLKYHAWFLGLVVFLLVTVPFFIKVEQSMPGFTEYFFYRENFLRFITKNYGDLYSGASHKVPHGVAIPMTMLVCLPWLFLPIYNLLANLKRSKNINLDAKTTSADSQPIRKRIFIAIHSFCDTPESLFPVGVISLTLFWSISSHLMLYYLVLLVPLFATWCASYMNKLDIKFSSIAKIAVVIMTLQLIAYFPTTYFADYKKSSKTVVAEAVRLLDESNDKSKIMFVRRVPYSAYFYATNRIIPHTEESLETSVKHGVEEKCAIFISRTKYVKKAGLRDFVKKAKLANFGEWTIIIPSVPDQEQRGR